MGVRGLTSYIAKRAEKFLEPYELHDTDLVIDGDNLASQLYKRTEHRLCAFGGNYDSYFATVVAFFAMLKKCNVKPYVLLDGGYEQKKMKTVRDRLLGRISSVKNIRILEGKRLAIPLMMREVFVDAMRQCNVSFYRCMFEADDEIAILARKLKCPVFSYDSDFYIHNVLYIPNVTLTHKVYKKTVKNEKNYEIQILNKGKSKRSRQNMKKVVVQDKMGPPSDTIDTPAESYFYMDCSIYQIENLVAQRKLAVEMVPLFACLIGNDYVERRMFRKFYSSIKLQRNNKNCTPQQQRIEKMFEWLRNETLHSAMGKIVERMKLENRKPLIRQIKAAISGYSSEESEAFAYFGLEEEVNEDDLDLGFAIEEFLTTTEKTEDSDGEDECPEEPDLSDNELEAKGESEEDLEEESDEEPAEPNIVEIPEEAFTAEENTRPHYRNNNSVVFHFPEWFKEKYQSAQLPRFAADLIFSKLYINFPQVEDILQKDSNEISLEILLHIFGLLQFPERSRLSYLTRTVRTTAYHFKVYPVDKMPVISDFDPLQRKNLPAFRTALGHLDVFDRLSEALPEQSRLYILAVIVWMEKSGGVNELHLHSVLLCFLLLRVVDKSAGHMHRNSVDFQKKFGPQLAAMRKDAETADSLDLFEQLTRENYQALVKGVSKSESLLALSNLTTYTTIGEKLQRRHVDFNRPLMHQLAQLQSICYNLYTLNALTNYPFEQIRMGESFNGFFIYQMYTNLKLRTMEPLVYVRNHLLSHSPHLLALHVRLFSFCMQFSTRIRGGLTQFKDYIAKASGKVAKKRGGRKKTKPEDKSKPEEGTETSSDSDTDSEEFEDLNNAFSKLLTI